MSFTLPRYFRINSKEINWVPLANETDFIRNLQMKSEKRKWNRFSFFDNFSLTIATASSSFVNFRSLNDIEHAEISENWKHWKRGNIKKRIRMQESKFNFSSGPFYSKYQQQMCKCSTTSHLLIFMVMNFTQFNYSTWFSVSAAMQYNKIIEYGEQQLNHLHASFALFCCVLNVAPFFRELILDSFCKNA